MGGSPTSLKLGIDGGARDREVVCIRLLCAGDTLLRYTTPPIYRALMDMTPIRTVALTQCKHARARITRALASAVSFCESQCVDLVVHPALIHVTARGIVCDIGCAPDTRLEPPEGGYSPAWSIGCVLHKMITGRAPVTPLDVENRTEMRALVRCLGAPTLSDSVALGIPVRDRARRSESRAKVPGASVAELIILRETLAWDPARRLVCGAGGLVVALDMIPEGYVDDDERGLGKLGKPPVT